MKRYGWAAGCLWPVDKNQDRMIAVTQLGFERDGQWVLINARHLENGVLMLLIRRPGRRAVTGGFDEKSETASSATCPRGRFRSHSDASALLGNG